METFAQSQYMQPQLNKSILLIEDEPVTAALQSKRLLDRGYRVSHVNNGPAAIDLITHAPGEFDLVISDIDLGAAMDGPQAAARILQIIDIPVLFLSSHTEPEIVQRTEEIASYGYVVKDSGLTVLDASIKMAFKLFEERSIVRQKQKELARLNEELAQMNRALREANQKLEASQAELLIREEDLKNSEARFRSLAEHVPGVIYLCQNNANYSMVYLNSQVKDLTGYDAQDFITGKINFVELYHPEDKERVFAEIQAALSIKQNFRLVYRLIHRDGSVRWIEEFGSGIYSGGELQYLEGFLADVTQKYS